MLILKKLDNIFTTIKILENNEEQFDKNIKLITDLPVREYFKEHRFWVVPSADLKQLVLNAKRKNIKIKSENISEIKDSYNKIQKWIKRQIRLRCMYDREKRFKKLLRIAKREMDVLNYPLYSFQSVGAYFAYNSLSDGAIIGDVVGLGKTVQALAVAEKRQREDETNFNLVICPSTLKRNWSDEISYFTDRKYNLVSGSKAQRKRIYKQSYKYDYLIVNYDVLRLDMPIIQEFILDRPGYNINLIIDEIQYINNMYAKRSKATKFISNRVDKKIGLSATLIENKVTDLFSSFHAIDHAPYGSERQYWSFAKRYVKFNYFGSAIGYKNPSIMKKRMMPYFIRRLKEEVRKELPQRIENNVWIELSPNHKKIYNEVKNQVVEEMKDLFKADKIKMANALALLSYLRQAVLSSRLVGYDENISSKTDSLIEFLHTINRNSKIVMFCHYPKMVEMLFYRLRKEGYRPMAIHGNYKLKHGVQIDDRIRKVRRFDESGKYDILVASDVLREGANIPSANYIINFDLLWNPQKIEQRVGRVDRLTNKHKSINIINIMAEKTVEEGIFEKQYDKRKMSVDILDSGKIEKRLTVNTIKSLLDIK